MNTRKNVLKTPTFTFNGARGAQAHMPVSVVLLHLDVVPHVDEALGLAGAGRGAGYGADPAPWPPRIPRPGPLLSASLLHAQAQVGGQPVRPDPVLHREHNFCLTK